MKNHNFIIYNFGNDEKYRINKKIKEIYKHLLGQGYSKTLTQYF